MMMIMNNAGELNMITGVVWESSTAVHMCDIVVFVGG